MSLSAMHPEDVKAELRKRYSSVAAFERAQGLPEKSVNDLLRGRASARVTSAIEDVLTKPVASFADSEGSELASRASPSSHRLNAGAR